MESQEAGFPPFPRSLEIPSGLPHSHDLDCWRIRRATAKKKKSQVEIEALTPQREL
jgi:hypothetical protein